MHVYLYEFTPGANYEKMGPENRSLEKDSTFMWVNDPIIPKPELRGLEGDSPTITTIWGDLGGLVAIICLVT